MSEVSKETLERYISIMTGIRNYHKRMHVGMSGKNCHHCETQEELGKCPTVMCNDIYCEAVEKCIELLKAEYERKYK